MMKGELAPSKLIAYVFYALLVYFAKDMTGNIDKLTSSVQELNINMAKVVVVQDVLKERVKDLEKYHKEK